eukprot:4461820-Amphidinium_carterae.2
MSRVGGSKRAKKILDVKRFAGVTGSCDVLAPIVLMEQSAGFPCNTAHQASASSLTKLIRWYESSKSWTKEIAKA